ncbi:hypothetical protein VNI00_001307 [Paramarasmius palmivorus]|uniref:F-box domain-containing protein n=1 Tax=Paramarasmius palmivorus TaxID=297713 RepID=A0AAW0E9C7_9AGAR
MDHMKKEECEIKAFDEEIARLQWIVADLEARRAVLAKRYDERRAAISGVRKLPIEILQSIFTQTYHPDTDAKDKRHQKNFSLYLCKTRIPNPSPIINLSQTSSHWRSVAKALPQLWTSILLDVTRLDIDVVPLIHTYLANSRGHPLRIRLNGCEPRLFQKEDVYGYKALRVLLKESMTRWAELHVDILHWDVITKHLGDTSTLDITFPALRTLRCLSDPLLHSGPPHWFWRAVQSAPKLDNVDVMYMPLLPCYSLPYRQLRSLIFAAAGGEHLLDRLASAPSLEVFEVHWFHMGAMFNDGAPPVPATVILPLLRTFAVHLTCSLMDFHTFFGRLELPSLERLRVESDRESVADHYTPPLSFLSALEHCSAHLKDLTLNLRWATMDKDWMSRILQVLPVLQRFSATFRGLEVPMHRASPCITHLLSRLVILPTDTRAVLTPKLEQLFIKELESLMNKEVLEMLLDVIESRSECTQREVVALSNVELSYQMNFVWQTQEQLSEAEILPASILSRIERLKDKKMSCTIQAIDT